MSVQVEKEIRKRSATLIDSSSGHTSSTSNISVQFSHSLNQSRHLDEELLNLQDKNNTGQSTRGRWSSLIFHIGSFAKPPKRRNSDDPLRILGNPSFEAYVKQSGNTDSEESTEKRKIQQLSSTNDGSMMQDEEGLMYEGDADINVAWQDNNNHVRKWSDSLNLSLFWQELWDSGEALFSSRVTWLLLFGPVALIGDFTGWLSEFVCFCFAALALIPCAER